MGKINVELQRETMGMTGIWNRIFFINIVQLYFLIQINVYKTIEFKKIWRKQIQLSVQ